MIRRLFFSVLMLVLSTLACTMPSGTPEPTPTQEFESVLEGAANNEIYAFQTKQAEDAIYERMMARATATQAILQATEHARLEEEHALATKDARFATQQVWQVTVEAGQARDAATEQAAIVQGTTTAQAQATATQMAVVGLTATVIFRETATADYRTQQAPILAAQQRAMDAQAQSMETKLRQEQATWFFWAWALPVLLIVSVIGAAFVLWNKSKVGTVSPDERGNYPLVLNNIFGEWRMTKANLLPSPVLEFKRGGTIMPVLTDAETQRQTTHGAQIVDAVRALPPGYQRQAVGLAGGLSAPASAVNIQVVQPGNVQGWIDDVQGQLSEHVEED